MISSVQIRPVSTVNIQIVEKVVLRPADFVHLSMDSLCLFLVSFVDRKKVSLLELCHWEDFSAYYRYKTEQEALPTTVFHDQQHSSLLETTCRRYPLVDIGCTLSKKAYFKFFIISFTLHDFWLYKPAISAQSQQIPSTQCFHSLSFFHFSSCQILKS